MNNRDDFAGMAFDLELFTALNEEYASKRLVPTPPVYSQNVLVDRGYKRAKSLNQRQNVKGKRVLEIGCGRGETAVSLATNFGCDVVGVDIEKYAQWTENGSSVRLIQADLSNPGEVPDIGQFDFAYSWAVWEHVRHPYAMLERIRSLLKPGATLYMSANLHRGPKASHRYRQVFFPWPHLLFSDDVFRQFYVSIGRPPMSAAWVNTLTSAHYLLYFQMLGFKVENISYRTTPIDEEFYARFEEYLGRYPRFDLERDFIEATLSVPE